MTDRNEFGQFARTIRHVPPAQLAHRIRLRGQKLAYGSAPRLTQLVFAADASNLPGWPTDFRPLDATTEAIGRPSLSENLSGRFGLLGEVHQLGQPIDWQPEGASQLWRYHLHYFDWAWVMLADPGATSQNAFMQLYRSWRAANPVGRWDAWSPYVVSLRAWTLCSLADQLQGDHEFAAQLEADLAVHGRYLRANVEFDVGGNHLIKNLKAIVGLGVYLGDNRAVRFGSRQLLRQLRIQILDDGGHYERSPGYHAQVLGDLLDVRDLLNAADRLPGVVTELEAATATMQRWLAALILPDTTVPLLNDSVPVHPARLDALGVDRSEPLSQLTTLEDSGYVVVRPRPGAMAVFDAGPPSPDELPAHAQADALAVLLHVDEQPVLLDTGTSTYIPGPRRQYERSTSAHNTVEIDGVDQTEVWGAFRAGRRHRAELLSATAGDTSTRLVGRHDGYRYLPGAPMHQRTVDVSAAGLSVYDEITGDGRHDIVLRWHLAVPAELMDDDQAVALGTHRLEWTAPGAEVRLVAPGAEPLGLIGLSHNDLQPAACLELALRNVQLPVVLETRLHFGPPSGTRHPSG